MVQYLLLSFLSCENGPDIQSHCTQRLEFFLNFKKIGFSLGGSGGTELERRYGDVRRWRPPFHTSPLVHKDPISSKRDSSQDRPPFEKIWKFWPLQPQFCPYLALKPVWKFSADKPLLSEANINSQAPHFGNPVRTPLPEKKKTECSLPPPTWVLLD